MSCVLSIIIPTKNRYSTLIPLLDSVCAIISNDFEIVIQDNSDNNDEILNYLKFKKDFRIKYFFLNETLSVIQNSDLAVNNSIGDYVCFIGDDDGVMPYIVEVVYWMRSHKILALKAFKPNYYWPDQKSNYLSTNTSGNLKFKSFSYNVNEVCTKKALAFTLKKGGTSMEMLPCLYHGIVERKVLNAIFEKCNTYFPGPSPDMANGIALAKFINVYTYVDFPVVISGKSAKSTGGQGVLHKHISKIEDVAHLPKETKKYWSSLIPKYWTGPTIWAESVLKSLTNCGDHVSIEKFRFSYLYASIILFNFSERKQIFKDFNVNIYTPDFFIDFVFIFYNRSLVFIKNRLGSKVVNSKRDLKTIGECINVLNKEIKIDFLPFKIN